MLWLAGVPHGSPSEYISDRLDMSYENCHAATHAKEGNGGTSQIKSIVGLASIQTDTIGPVHL